MKILKKLVYIALLGVSVHLQASDERKGLDIREDARLSMKFDQTVHSNANGNGVMTSDDVVVGYKYSNENGTGKQFVLRDQSNLRSGDKFTVYVQANKNVFVYLYHSDSHGETNELISMSGYKNYLQAGQTLTLPAENKHFFLDDKTGQEMINTVVSSSALSLTQGSDNSPITNDKINALVPKGIIIGNDNNIAAGNGVITQKKTSVAEGYTVQCQALDSACRDTFVINHLPR
ncbi:DUF4384 domain-containing protein [Beggiatoa leptomitoformis]|uniref:DUF4384 domain-containing protein n=1 Tax=Beggiatoa leptomitoformis TaxID=288004 RepID=A0A2N9YBC9_9GAMM|nr:DUF4384 domain-containing protein [Beggiatoa leptomitoformis]ALG66874.1 DUF4384 domain-containing protein [Beggiatoa leptomitoformis]AUI67771.1 DUF4384 domain-containing protein [Beggiatoa leptomitoformis]